MKVTATQVQVGDIIRPNPHAQRRRWRVRTVDVADWGVSVTAVNMAVPTATATTEFTFGVTETVDVEASTTEYTAYSIQVYNVSTGTWINHATGIDTFDEAKDYLTACMERWGLEKFRILEAVQVTINRVVVGDA